MERPNFLRHAASSHRLSRRKGRRNRKSATSWHARSWGLLPERLEDRLLLTIFTVSNTSNDATVSGSLPFEVLQANADTSDEAVIEFADAAGQTFATHQTITLKATLTLDHASAPKDPISIVGPTAGLTISGGGAGSDFSVITVTADTQQAAIKGDSASGPITITNGNLTGSSENGAGINDMGDLVLENVAITDNKASGSTGSGGGIEVVGAPNPFANPVNPGAALLASDTTFSGNTATAQGGGVDMEGTAALIVNSTFSGNSAGAFGGAIYNGPTNLVSGFAGINLGIVNDTISGNSVGADGDSGGIDNNNGGIMGILNSIVAGNTVASGAGAVDIDSGGSSGIYAGSSHDVVGNASGLSGSGITDGSNGDVVGHPALLAALGDYGAANDTGAVSTGTNDLQTFALLPGSPAINDAVVMANVDGSGVSASTTTFTATTPLPLPPLNGSTFPYEQGKDILVGSEEMLVTGVTPTSGSNSKLEYYNLTVTRGVNGTAAAAHNSGDPIFLPDQRGVFASSNSVGSFQTQGFNVTAQSGDTPQSTGVSKAFTNALGVTVTANDPNGVVNGGIITYSAPTTGASATLSTGTATIANGDASVTATANATAGSYTVGASAGFGTAATFSLTNVAAAATISVTVSSVAVTEGATFNGGVATFTDTNAAENAASDFTATINWGDSHSSTGVVSAAAGGGFSVTGTHQYAEAGTMPVTVTITDNNGVVGSATHNATVDDAPLTAGAAATFTAVEGANFSGQVGTFTDGNPLAATSDFTASILWGDGKSSTGAVAVAGASFVVNATHTYAEEGTYTVTASIADTGGSKATDTAKAVVADATLQATSADTIGFIAGTTQTKSLATFTDAGGAEALSDYSATIDWGDGSGTTTASIGNPDSQGVFTISGTHNYASVGTDPITITLHHDTAAAVTLSATADAGGPETFNSPGGDVTVDVANGKLQILTGSTVAASFTLTEVNSLTVNGKNDVANSFTLDYSGGSFLIPGGITFNGGTLPGTPSNSLSIKGGTFDTDTFDFTSAHDGSVQWSANGQTEVVDYTNLTPLTNTGTATNAVFSLPSGTATVTLDSASAGNLTISSGSSTFETTTIAAPSGTLTVNANGNTVNLGSNFYSTFSGKLVVNGAANTLSVHALGVSSLSATEAAMLSATLATFTDPNGALAASDYSATINWGDGGSVSTVAVSAPSANGVFTISGSHVYAIDSATPATVAVVIHRAGATDVTVNDSVSVADAPLTGTSASIAAGVTVSGAVASFSDPDTSDAPSDYSATIDWGDGSGTSTGTISATSTPGTFNVVGNHTYTSASSHTITVTVNHGTDQALPISSLEPGSPVTFTISDHTYVIGTGTITVSADNGVLSGDKAPSQLSATAGTLTGAQGGTFTINADGSFTYTPGGNFPGYDSAQVAITDASGDKGTETVTVLSQHAAVVWKFYESVLNRTPDPSGLQYWTNYFNNGGQTGQMAVGFFESTELLDKIITNYYQQYLLRTPDASGLSFWVSQWQATGEPEGIKAGFADSPEFYNSAGGTPSTWLTALYQRILSRTPDPAGFQFWLNYYQQQSAAGVAAGNVQQQIALGFFESAEAYGDDVTGWFQEYLLRVPTAAEQSQYASQMEAGATDRTIEEAITNLPEYANTPPAPAAGAAAALSDFYQTSSQNQAVVSAKDALFGSL